jgi:cytochrome b561
MKIFDTKERFGTVSRTIHWIMALMIFILWCVGLSLANNIIPPESKKDVMGTHKSIGIIVLSIAFIRVIWRFYNIKPSASSFPAYSRILSKLNTMLFYSLMFIFPLSGILMSLAFGRNIAVFGVVLSEPVEMLQSPVIGKYAHETHEICGYLFAVALALHILGALYHTFFLKDQLLKRMWGR